MRILGIDPGSNATGYGVVDRVDRGLIYVDHGVLRPPRGAELALRLAFLHEAISDVIARYRPECGAVEKVFLASNPSSALVLGQARGVALAALAGANLPVKEIAAREVKKGVVGTGAASKSQVQEMVVRLLALDKKPQSDAADALAIAICEAHRGPLAALGVGQRRRRRFTARDIEQRQRS